LRKWLYEPQTLSSDPWLSVRECPKFLRIIQKPNFDISFQKKHVQAILKTSAKSRKKPQLPLFKAKKGLSVF
jgi:hypothetical protein